ncbi:unnamed protein product [Urochloa humidicola]
MATASLDQVPTVDELASHCLPSLRSAGSLFADSSSTPTACPQCPPFHRSSHVWLQGCNNSSLPKTLWRVAGGTAGQSWA